MSRSAYSTPAILLHWLMALLILAALPLGLYMTGLSLSPDKLKLYAWHKWLGVTVFALAWLRLAWRLTHPAPALPRSVPGWQRTAAKLMHAVLYVLLLAIPLSGWLMSSAKGFQTVYLGVLPLPDPVAKDAPLGERLEAVHAWLNYVLMGLLSLHVAAGLKHHFVDRDEILIRMLPWLRSRKETP